jgi:beta-N-acetylhexosaminidase
VRSGLDIYIDVPYISGTVGLLTNAASLARDGRTAYQALRDSGMDIVSVFAPEFGYYGIGAPREIIPDDHRDPLPVHRLNGEYARPAPEFLRSITTLVVDLQEVGTRFHPFVNTLYQVMVACAECGTTITILDRPNPLTGVVVEGPLSAPEYLPSVLPAEMPIRHGLTIGEMARWMNDIVNADLNVIALEGWKRDAFYGETGLPWTSPAPDLPYLDSALLFPGTSLLECFSLSAGYGTPIPYQQIGAPYINADMLTSAMNELYLEGVSFTPAWFRPQIGNYAGQPCEGVRVHINDVHQVRSFELGLHLFEKVRDLYPDDFNWASDDSTAVFDMLVGTSRIREELEAGREAERIISDCRLEAADFQSDTVTYWLYE